VFGVSPNVSSFSVLVLSCRYVPYPLGAPATAIRVYQCPSVVKKTLFAKRTHFPLQASINQNDMHIETLPIKVNQGSMEGYCPEPAHSHISGYVSLCQVKK